MYFVHLTSAAHTDMYQAPGPYLGAHMSEYESIKVQARLIFFRKTDVTLKLFDLTLADLPLFFTLRHNYENGSPDAGKIISVRLKVR